MNDGPPVHPGMRLKQWQVLNRRFPKLPIDTRFV